MKTHELFDYQATVDSLNLPLVPQTIYRKGKYVTILGSEESYVWHKQIDYRRYKRLINRHVKKR